MILSQDVLSDKIERYIKNIELNARPDKLYTPIRYALDTGGKRLRPLLVLASANVFTDDVDRVLPVAGAVEVFHNFTLLHDDIMDNASVRRGRPSVFAEWGTNGAILSGDVMMIRAYALLEKVPPAMLPEIFAEFNAMAREVCEGQQMDMDFEKADTISESLYLQMIRLKTSELMAHGLRMGARMGGAASSQARAMYDFGVALGLAFQIHDDLLDTFGTTEILGKEVGGDIMEGKKTFLAINAMAVDPERTKALFSADDLNREQKLIRARELYERLGVRKLTERAIEDYTRRAISALDGVQGDTSLIRDIAEQLIKRDK